MTGWMHWVVIEAGNGMAGRGMAEDWAQIRHGWWIAFLICNEIVRHTVIAGVMIGGIHALAWVVKLTSELSGVSVVDTPLAILPMVGVVHLKQLLLTIDAVFIVRFATEAYRDVDRIYTNANQ